MTIKYEAKRSTSSGFDALIAGSVATGFIGMIFVIPLLLLRFIFSSKQSAIFSGSVVLFFLVAFNPTVNKVELPIPQQVVDGVESVNESFRQAYSEVF